MSRFFSFFRQLRAGASGPAPTPGYTGETGADRKLTEKTAAWPAAGPAGAGAFNRATKGPVVKTRAAKKGIA